MSRIRNFAGLAVVVLLVATASLAQAQGQRELGYWNVAGPGDWFTKRELGFTVSSVAYAGGIRHRQWRDRKRR